MHGKKNTNRDDGNKRNNQKCHKQTGAKFDSSQHIWENSRVFCAFSDIYRPPFVQSDYNLSIHYLNYKGNDRKSQ